MSEKDTFKIGDRVLIKNTYGADWIKKGKIYSVCALEDGEPIFEGCKDVGWSFNIYQDLFEILSPEPKFKFLL